MKDQNQSVTVECLVRHKLYPSRSASPTRGNSDSSSTADSEFAVFSSPGEGNREQLHMEPFILLNCWVTLTLKLVTELLSIYKN